MYDSIAASRGVLPLQILPLMGSLKFFSNKGTRSLRTSKCPSLAAKYIGVQPSWSGALGFSTNGIRNSTISAWPFSAAKTGEVLKKTR